MMFVTVQIINSEHIRFSEQLCDNQKSSLFFDQVGHQSTDASIMYWKRYFFNNNSDLVRLIKIMNNLVKDLKILSSKSFYM